MSLNIYDKTTDSLNPVAGRVGDAYTKAQVDAKIAEVNRIKNIVSDEWISGGTYNVGSYAIDNNKLYKAVGAGGGSVRPSTDTGHTVWVETKVENELSDLNSKLSNKTLRSVISGGTLDANGLVYIGGYLIVDGTVYKPIQCNAVLAGAWTSGVICAIWEGNVNRIAYAAQIKYADGNPVVGAAPDIEIIWESYKNYQ